MARLCFARPVLHNWCARARARHAAHMLGGLLQMHVRVRSCTGLIGREHVLGTRVRAKSRVQVHGDNPARLWCVHF